jgi:PAS domain S-box-containing protein
MKFKSLMFCCIMFFLAAFGGFVYVFQRNAHAGALSRINSHAKIIASSLWTFEKASPTAYLALAVEANGYDRIVVDNDNGGQFLTLTGAPSEGVEHLLRSVGLIPVFHLESVVAYKGNPIGTIQADWPCRTIYTYFYILFCIVLLVTGLGLFLKLIDANRFLEDRVRLRTAELEREVNERRRAEEEIKSYAQRLAMHVLHTPLGVIEWDMDFRVIEWNKAAESMFGFSRDEALGRKAYDLILPSEELEYIEQVWAQLLAQTGGTRVVNINRTKRGDIRVCEWYNTCITDPAGSVIGVASLVEDITERKRAEQEKQRLEAQLLQAQKMEAVGELAGGIAHDFNNLLQSISGYTQLLLIECRQMEQVCSRLRGIERASMKAADLVRQLLTFSRKIDSQLRPLNLNHAIEQMKEMLERTIPKMIAFQYHLAPGLKDIEGDPTQIEQIIMNLAINAMHAMPEGGTIVIETTNASFNPELRRRRRDDPIAGPCVVLSVADTGVGMDQETLNRIYEPFFTTKGIGRGTGLGLAMVYGIVKSHRAQITCSSEPAKGTRFRIFFPVAATGRPAKEEKSVVEEIPGGTETILLIDDDAAVRDIGAQMLARHGYTILTAPDGEEALRLYKDHQERIDLVVLDLNMPGMGGYKCMLALKAIRPDIKILIASGYAQRGDRQPPQEDDAYGYIAKPFQLLDFMKKVRLALNE